MLYRRIKNIGKKIASPFLTYKDQYILKQYLKKGYSQKNIFSFEILKETTLNYIESLRIGQQPWDYAYSYSSPYSSIYNSTYVLMLRSMFLGPTAGLTVSERKKFAEYFLDFQDKNSGYFIDRSLDDGVYIKQDNENYLWWGYGHCLLHVLPCLMILGIQPKYKFNFLEKYYDLNFFDDFLHHLDFEERVHYTGNILMNIGVALQYDALITNSYYSQATLDFLKKFLLKKINSKNIWGSLNKNTGLERSINIQAAYHFWPLFFYQHDDIPISNELFDYLIQSQNSLGGFGIDAYHSSACEDIDTIEPLARFYHQMSSQYQIKTKKTFFKALPWIFANQNKDGGFVFMRNRPLHYGHDHLSSKKNESAMFPTWFRILSLAHIMRTTGLRENFYFCNCPGFLY
ncbi:hypothetical protein [Desulfovibrio piger]|uniref:hypothetical protein n=1 Tax=Desulfovibrio piger TaxID=901 RepID=UPI0026EE6C87|nr:hypothetical protein [Desulfovibrio piger]